MTSFQFKLAGIPMRVHAFYASTGDFCGEYLTEEAPLLELTLTREDLILTRRLSAETDLAEGRAIYPYPDAYLETLALCRRAMDALLQYNVLLFHGSVVAVGGKAYLFTAKSGTGKTTHTNLWLKNIPDCHVLNGDKPLLLFREGRVYACGSPWQGKENYGTNEILPLGAICLLERGTENSIEEIPFNDAFAALTVQSHHPRGTGGLVAAVRLLGKLSAVNLYRLHCNMEDEAALVAYHGMVKQ